MRSRRTTTLREYRSALKTSGDVLVGAYARSQRRRRILIGVGGVAMIGIAIGLYTSLRPGAKESGRGQRPVLIHCMSCGYEGVVYVEAQASDQPITCPKCGARAGRKVWECRDCGYRFLAKGRPEELRCPKCGSRRVGTAEAVAGQPLVGTGE